MAPLVTVFGSSRSLPGDGAYMDAERCGRLLAAAGFVVSTGGYDGTMEAVSKGARDAGGHVVGVTAPSVFPGRPGANPYVHEERRAATITERLHALIDPADAIIALPGSIGTFTELIVAWNANYLAPGSGHPPRALVAVGDTWAEFLDLLTARLDVPPGLAACAATVDAAVERVTAALRP